MGGKKSGKRDTASASSPTTALPPARDGARNLRVGVAAAVAITGGLGVFWLVAVYLWMGTPDQQATRQAGADFATHVCDAVCAGCHVGEGAAWRRSHHALAMEKAQDGSVLGDFNNSPFTYFDVTLHFLRRNGRFFVNTDGRDGQMADFPIAYTVGVFPLQQYLIEFPDGRNQTLSIAWDARPKEAGGQRWFHLYPDQPIHHGDILHWTGLNQNWNFMCAECHTTDLRKNYDAASDRYRTAWSELGVSCEVPRSRVAARGMGQGLERRGRPRRRAGQLRSIGRLS